MLYAMNYIISNAVILAFLLKRIPLMFIISYTQFHYQDDYHPLSVVIMAVI